MVITEASKLSNFSCSSSKVIGVSLACTTRVSSLYSSPRPSSIFLGEILCIEGCSEKGKLISFCFDGLQESCNAIRAFGD